MSNLETTPDSDKSTSSADIHSEHTSPESQQTPREMVEMSLAQNPSFKWYVLRVITGHENKVVTMLRERLKNENMEEKIGAILIPSEDLIEKKDGKARKINKKFFPGYIMMHLEMSDALWHLSRGLTGVQGFVGGAKNKPIPVPYVEVEKVLKKLGKEGGKIKHKMVYDPGESVRVIEGPFADFNGVVEEVHYDKNKLVVAVLIFGRSTPVELEFSQVEKTV